jgi:hypothetical protein
MLEANETEVLRKIVGKTKIDKEANKSENSVVTNVLMSGWKEEEENGMNM